MAYSSPSSRIPDSGAESVSELWEHLNLGELLEGVKRTNDSTASANKGKDPFVRYQKVLSNPGYNAIAGRYKTGPRQPRQVSRETLKRLADPARGKFDSPSRRKEIVFDQSDDREAESSGPESASRDKGTSFFLTEFDDGKSPKKPPRSLFRSRLEEAARAAGTIAEEDGPLPPSAQQAMYRRVQASGIGSKHAENKRKANLVDALLNGRRGPAPARSAKRIPKPRDSVAPQALARGRKAAQPVGRTAHGGIVRERNGRVSNKKPVGRSNQRGSSVEPKNRGVAVPRGTRDNSVGASSRNRAGDTQQQQQQQRGRDVNRSAVKRNSSRSRDPSAPRPAWTDASMPVSESKPSAVAAAAAVRDRSGSRGRPARGPVGGPAASGSSTQVSTGVLAGSRSAAAIIRRKPPDSEGDPVLSRARTEQRVLKRVDQNKSSVVPRGGRGKDTSRASGNTDLNRTASSVETSDVSLQYSQSNAGSPGKRSTRAGSDAGSSPAKSLGVNNVPVSPKRVDIRRRLLEKKADAAAESGRAGGQRPRGGATTVKETLKSSTRTSFDAKSQRAKIVKSLTDDNDGSVLVPSGNIEKVLQRAEYVASLVNKDNGASVDTDTATFASLLATHARRISGQLASAQQLANEYKRLAGIQDYSPEPLHHADAANSADAQTKGTQA